MASYPKVLPPIIMVWVILMIDLVLVISNHIVKDFTGLFLYLFFIGFLVTVAVDVLSFALFCVAIILSIIYVIVFIIVFNDFDSKYKYQEDDFSTLLIIINVFEPIPLISYSCLMKKFHDLYIKEQKDLLNSEVKKLEPLGSNE